MKNKRAKRKSKVIAATVRIDIWNKLKIEAIKQSKTTGELLDIAIDSYLQKRKSDLFDLGLGFPLE